MKLRIALLFFLTNVAAASAQTIALAPITKLAYCIGDTLNVGYVATGSFDPSNVFTAELSNSNGSFQTPTMVGDNTNDSGLFQIPLTTSGPGYRVRVVSSSPPYTSSNNGQDIGVSNFPVPTAWLTIGTNRLSPTATDSTGGPAVMVGQLAQFSATAFPFADTFYWTFDEDASMQTAIGTNVGVSYPSAGIKDGLLSAVNASGCGTTIAFSIRVLDCSPTIPSYARIVTGAESVADSFVWVKPGGVDTVVPTSYPQTIFVESAGSVYTASAEDWITYYIKAGGSIDNVPARGTIVSSSGTRDTFAATTPADTLSCTELEFQSSSSVMNNVPQPPVRIAQNGNRLVVSSDRNTIAVQVLSVLGAEVFSQHGSGVLDVDLSSLKSGVYFAVAQAGNAREMTKIVIVH